MDESRQGHKSANAFRTISEVARALDLPQHVLRFWETKFNQIKPMKRGGGRRYYRPEDVELLDRIRRWLYEDGYTIKGVQKLLRDGAPDEDRVVESGLDENAPSGSADANPNERPNVESLREILSELKEIRARLS